MKSSRHIVTPGELQWVVVV